MGVITNNHSSTAASHSRDLFLYTFQCQAILSSFSDRISSVLQKLWLNDGCPEKTHPTTSLKTTHLRVGCMQNGLQIRSCISNMTLFTGVGDKLQWVLIPWRIDKIVGTTLRPFMPQQWHWDCVALEVGSTAETASYQQVTGGGPHSAVEPTTTASSVCTRRANCSRRSGDWAAGCRRAAGHAALRVRPGLGSKQQEIHSFTAHFEGKSPAIFKKITSHYYSSHYPSQPLAWSY